MTRQDKLLVLNQSLYLTEHFQSQPSACMTSHLQSQNLHLGYVRLNFPYVKNLTQPHFLFEFSLGSDLA